MSTEQPAHEPLSKGMQAYIREAPNEELQSMLILERETLQRSIQTVNAIESEIEHRKQTRGFYLEQDRLNTYVEFRRSGHVGRSKGDRR